MTGRPNQWRIDVQGSGLAPGGRGVKQAAQFGVRDAKMSSQRLQLGSAEHSLPPNLLKDRMGSKLCKRAPLFRRCSGDPAHEDMGTGVRRVAIGLEQPGLGCSALSKATARETTRALKSPWAQTHVLV